MNIHVVPGKGEGGINELNSLPNNGTFLQGQRDRGGPFFLELCVPVSDMLAELS